MNGDSLPQKRRPRRSILAKKKDRYIVGLDVGTHKICAIVAELTEEGRLDVIGRASCRERVSIDV